MLTKTTRWGHTKGLPPYNAPQYGLKVLGENGRSRLRQLLENHLTSNQFCGVSGNSIFHAVATRDPIAYAERKEIPMCVLFLNFRKGFDRTAHE
jgi:hypothetical protein